MFAYSELSIPGPLGNLMNITMTTLRPKPTSFFCLEGKFTTLITSGYFVWRFGEEIPRNRNEFAMVTKRV
jgi:hypothetical protein